MIRSSAFAVAAASFFVMIMPGMVQNSSASGSAFEQKKAAEENEAYKALSIGDTNSLAGAIPTVTTPARSAAGVVPDEKVTPWVPMYQAPRGGREY